MSREAATILEFAQNRLRHARIIRQKFLTSIAHPFQHFACPEPQFIKVHGRRRFIGRADWKIASLIGDRRLVTYKWCRNSNVNAFAGPSDFRA